MRKSPVESSRLTAEERKYLPHALRRFLPAHESPFHGHRKAHYAESGTSGSYGLIRAQPFPRKSAHRVGVVPEILESLLLDQRKQFLVADAGEFVRGVVTGGQVNRIIVYEIESEVSSLGNGKRIAAAEIERTGQFDHKTVAAGTLGTLE